MAWWRRSDGDLVRDVPNLRRIMPYVMRTRTESAVYFEHHIDVGRAERFVRTFNEVHPDTRAGVFHVLLWACARGLHELPNLNRFVAGGRLYQRRGVWISFSVKQRLREGAPLLVIKREFPAGESFLDMVVAIHEEVQAARFGRQANAVDTELRLVLMAPGWGRRLLFGAYRLLEAYGLFPRGFVDNDPLYASVFLTDLGSLGLDAAFHHLYEYGTIGLFGVLGRARAQQVPDPDSGRLERRRLAMLRWTFDERVDDGLAGGYGLRFLRRIVEDPVGQGITAGDPAVQTRLDDARAEAERA